MKYSESGVDIDKGMESVRRIKKLVKNTYSKAVLSDIGSFGAMYRASFPGMNDPVLVSSADGVGTKLLIAEQMNFYENCGKDIVNHSINDILAVGAKPLYFMDYIGCGKVDPDIVEKIISSMAAACSQQNISLIGGELAEMSEVYANIHYDIVGFITGIVDRKNILSGINIKKGDLILGLPSNGFHTNGYSLIRKIIKDRKLNLERIYSDMEEPLFMELLKPHRPYRKELEPLLDEGIIEGIAHITGGGFFDNISRILPEGTKAVIRKESYEIPPLFNMFKTEGDLDENEAYRVFNMGIGIVFVISPDTMPYVSDYFKSRDIVYYDIGYIEDGAGVKIV